MGRLVFIVAILHRYETGTQILYGVNVCNRRDTSHLAEPMTPTTSADQATVGFIVMTVSVSSWVIPVETRRMNPVIPSVTAGFHRRYWTQ